MKPGGLCSPSDGSSSPSGDDIGSVSAACKALGGGSQFPDASTSEDSPACLTPDLIEDRHQGAKPNSSIANGYICNDVTNGLCETLYDTEKDIDVPRHVLSPPCSEDGDDGASRSRSLSAGGGACKGSDSSTLYQGRCKTPEPIKGRSPAPSNKAKSLPPQLSVISLDESPAGTSEHSSSSVYNESVDVKVASGSNCIKETLCSEPQSMPHNIKSPKYRRKCSLEELVAKLHSRSDPIVPTGSGALQAFSSRRTNPEPMQERVTSCFTKTEGDGELSSPPQSEREQSICDNSNTATCDVHLPSGSSSNQALSLCDSGETAKACDELCVYNANLTGDRCEGVESSVGKEGLDQDRSKFCKKEITCESDTFKKHLGVSSSLDVKSSPVAVTNSDLTDSRTDLVDKRTAAYFCVSNDNVSNVPKDAQSDVLVDVSRTTSEKVTIENDAKFELKEKRFTSHKCDSSSINKKPQNISVEAVERKESDEIEVLTSREKSVVNEVINLIDDDTGDSGSDLEILFEKGRNISTGKLAAICSKRLGKGKIEKKEFARKSSLAGSKSGKAEYLEPISDEENSLICAPSPPSELSSASGFPSSSGTPLFSDTPSDASRGAIMVKISDAVAAILSDVSDDSLPPSPEECSDQNSFSNIIPKLIEINDKCSGSPVRSSFSGASVTDSVVGESSSCNQDSEKRSEELEMTPPGVTGVRVTSGDDVCGAQSDDKKCESSDLILVSSGVDSSCVERSTDSPKEVEITPTSSNENESNHIEHTKTKSVNTSLDLSESQEQSANVGVPSSSTNEDSGSSGHSGPPQLVKSLVHRFPCCSCSMHSTALLSNDPCNTNSCQKPTSGTPCLSSQPNICNRLRSECRECVPGLDGEDASPDACCSCMSIGELHLGVHRKEEPSTASDSKDPVVAAASDVGNERKEAETVEICHGNILSLSVPNESEEPNTSPNGILTHPPNIPKEDVEIASLSEGDKVTAEARKSAVAGDVVDKIESLTACPGSLQESVSESSPPETVLAREDLSSSVLRDDSNLQTTDATVECTEGCTNPASTSVAIHSNVNLSSNIAFYEGRSQFPGSRVDEDSSAPAESIEGENESPQETQDSSNVHSLPKVSEGGYMPTPELSNDSKLEGSDNLLSNNPSIEQVSNIENLSQLAVPNNTNQILLGIVSCKKSDNSVNTLSQNLNSEIERTAQKAYGEASLDLGVKSGRSSEIMCSDKINVSSESDHSVPPLTTDVAIPNPASDSDRIEEEERVSSSSVTETQSVHASLLNPKEPRKDSSHNSNAPDISPSWNSLENSLALPSPHKTSLSQESHSCQPLPEGPTERITSSYKDIEHRDSVITDSPKDGRLDHSVNLEDEYPSGGKILTSTAEEEKTEFIPISECESSKNHLAEASRVSEGKNVVEGDSMIGLSHSVATEEPLLDACNSPRNPEDVTPSAPLEKELEDLKDNSLGNTSSKESISAPSNDGISIKEHLPDTVPISSYETEFNKPFPDSANSDLCPEVLEKSDNTSENKALIGTADSQAADSNILAILPKADQAEILQDSVVTESDSGQNVVDEKGTDSESKLVCETPRNTEVTEAVLETLPDCSISNFQTELQQAEVVCHLLPETETKLTVVSNLEVECGHSTDLLTETIDKREDATSVKLGIDLSEMPNSTLFETKNCILPNHIGLNPSAATQPIELKVSESSLTTISSTKSYPILSERVEEKETTNTINKVHAIITETSHEANTAEKSTTIPVGENSNDKVAPECDKTLGNKVAAGATLDSIISDKPGENEDVELSEGSDNIESQQETDNVENQQETDDIKNQQEADDIENQQETDDIENQQEMDNVENQQEMDNVENQQETDDIQNQQETDNVENQQEADNVESQEETDNLENQQETDNLENQQETDIVENQQETDNVENQQETDNIQNQQETDNVENQQETDNVESQEETDNLENQQETDNVENQQETDNIENQQETCATEIHESSPEHLKIDASCDTLKSNSLSESDGNKTLSETYERFPEVVTSSDASMTEMESVSSDMLSDNVAKPDLGSSSNRVSDEERTTLAPSNTLETKTSEQTEENEVKSEVGSPESKQSCDDNVTKTSVKSPQSEMPLEYNLSRTLSESAWVSTSGDYISVEESAKLIIPDIAKETGLNPVPTVDDSLAQFEKVAEISSEQKTIESAKLVIPNVIEETGLNPIPITDGTIAQFEKVVGISSEQKTTESAKLIIPDVTEETCLNPVPTADDSIAKFEEVIGISRELKTTELEKHVIPNFIEETGSDPVPTVDESIAQFEKVVGISSDQETTDSVVAESSGSKLESGIIAEEEKIEVRELSLGTTIIESNEDAKLALGAIQAETSEISNSTSLPKLVNSPFETEVAKHIGPSVSEISPSKATVLIGTEAEDVSLGLAQGKSSVAEVSQENEADSHSLSLIDHSCSKLDLGVIEAPIEMETRVCNSTLSHSVSKALQEISISTTGKAHDISITQEIITDDRLVDEIHKTPESGTLGSPLKVHETPESTLAAQPDGETVESEKSQKSTITGKPFETDDNQKVGTYEKVTGTEKMIESSLENIPEVDENQKFLLPENLSKTENSLELKPVPEPLEFNEILESSPKMIKESFTDQSATSHNCETGDVRASTTENFENNVLTESLATKVPSESDHTKEMIVTERSHDAVEAEKYLECNIPRMLSTPEEHLEKCDLTQMSSTPEEHPETNETGDSPETGGESTKSDVYKEPSKVEEILELTGKSPGKDDSREPAISKGLEPDVTTKASTNVVLFETKEPVESLMTEKTNEAADKIAESGMIEKPLKFTETIENPFEANKTSEVNKTAESSLTEESEIEKKTLSLCEGMEKEMQSLANDDLLETLKEKLSEPGSSQNLLPERRELFDSDKTTKSPMAEDPPEINDAVIEEIPFEANKVGEFTPKTDEVAGSEIAETILDKALEELTCDTHHLETGMPVSSDNANLDCALHPDSVGAASDISQGVATERSLSQGCDVTEQSESLAQESRGGEISGPDVFNLPKAPILSPRETIDQSEKILVDENIHSETSEDMKDAVLEEKTPGEIDSLGSSFNAGDGEKSSHSCVKIDDKCAKETVNITETSESMESRHSLVSTFDAIEKMESTTNSSNSATLEILPSNDKSVENTPQRSVPDGIVKVISDPEVLCSQACTLIDFDTHLSGYVKAEEEGQLLKMKEEGKDCSYENKFSPPKSADKSGSSLEEDVVPDKNDGNFPEKLGDCSQNISECIGNAKKSSKLEWGKLQFENSSENSLKHAANADRVTEKGESPLQKIHDLLNEDKCKDGVSTLSGMELIPYENPSAFLDSIMNDAKTKDNIPLVRPIGSSGVETPASKTSSDKSTYPPAMVEELVSCPSIPDETPVGSEKSRLENQLELSRSSSDSIENIEFCSEVRQDAETCQTNESLSQEQGSGPCIDNIDIKVPGLSKGSDGVILALKDSNNEDIDLNHQSASLETREESLDASHNDAMPSHTVNKHNPDLTDQPEMTELSVTKETVEHLSSNMNDSDNKTSLNNEGSRPSHDCTESSVVYDDTSASQETKPSTPQLDLHRTNSFEEKDLSQSLEAKGPSPPQVLHVAQPEEESLAVANKENQPIEVCSLVNKTTESEDYQQGRISFAASAKEAPSVMADKNIEHPLGCSKNNSEAANVFCQDHSLQLEPVTEEVTSRVAKEQVASEEMDVTIDYPSITEASHGLCEPSEKHVNPVPRDSSTSPHLPSKRASESFDLVAESVDLEGVVSDSSLLPANVKCDNSDAPRQNLDDESAACRVSDGDSSVMSACKETQNGVPRPPSNCSEVESSLSDECASPKKATEVEGSTKNKYSLVKCAEENIASNTKSSPEPLVTSEDHKTNSPEDTNIPVVSHCSSLVISCIEKAIDHKFSSAAVDSDIKPMTETSKPISNEVLSSNFEERKIPVEPFADNTCAIDCSSEEIDSQEISVSSEIPAEVPAKEVDGTEKKDDSGKNSLTTDNPQDLNPPQKASTSSERDGAATEKASISDEGDENSLLKVVEVKREVCFSGEDSLSMEDTSLSSCNYHVKGGVITILDDKVEDDTAVEPAVLESLCPLCREALSEPLEEHIIKHHVCVSFIPAKSTDDYRNHMVPRVSESLDVTPEFVTDEFSYVCRSCQFSSKDINAVRFHLNCHEDIYQVRTGAGSCDCDKKVYSYQFHRWKSLIHNTAYYCGTCSYYFACERGLMNHVTALHYVQSRCKICNEEIADDDLVFHLYRHNSDAKGEVMEEDVPEIQMTTRSKGCYGVSWNIYDNFLNYLDGKDFRLNVASKVPDENLDRSYLTLPIRNVLDEVTVPDKVKLDPSKDIRKYLQGKKDIRASEGEINEALKNFSWFVQMHLEKKSGIKKGKGSNSHGKAKKENDLFDVLGIRTVKLRSSSKKDSGSPDSVKSSKRKSLENKLASPPEEASSSSDPSLTRTRSGMQPNRDESDNLVGDFMSGLGLERNVEVNGEWSREHTYVCCSCGAGYLDLADMMDHKWECHPSVWCAHTMFQGQDSVPQSFCSQFQPPTGRPTKLPSTTSLSPVVHAGLSQIIQGTPDPKTEGTEDEAKDKSLLKCLRCGLGFAEVEVFHSHLVECGGLHQMVVIKKKNKKGFRFKRRKGQGVPSNRYGASSHPSTPLKAKFGDRSSGLNTPLLDKSHSSLIQSSGVKRRLELAIGSINNHELKNRLKAIISGTKGSSAHTLSVPSRRTIKMKLRKKAFDSRLLRKTRHSDRAKEDASKTQKGEDTTGKLPKNDEKQGGTAIKEEKVDADVQLAKKTLQKKGNLEVGKDKKLQEAGEKSSPPEGSKNKVKKSGSSGKLSGGKKSAPVSEIVVGSGNVGVTTSVAADVLGDLSVAKKKPKGGKKLQAEKKVNGLISACKQKAASDTKQLVTSASDTKPVDVKKALAKKILAKKIKTISNVTSDSLSDKVVNIVDSDSLIGNKEISVQKRLKQSEKQKLSKTAHLKTKVDKAVPSKSDKAKSKKSKGSQKDVVKPKASTGKTGKPLDLVTDVKILKAPKKAKLIVPVVTENKIDPQISLPEVPSQLPMKKKVKETQPKDSKPSGALSSKTKSPGKMTTSTVASPVKKSKYISSSSSEEIDDDSEDSEPEVIRNFRSGRGCTGRLGLRNKSRPMLSRYSFRTCLEPEKGEEQDGVEAKEEEVVVEGQPVAKPEVSGLDPTLSSDKGELSDALPLSKKRKRKIANYENQDDCAYVPDENSSDSEDYEEQIIFSPLKEDT